MEAEDLMLIVDDLFDECLRCNDRYRTHFPDKTGGSTRDPIGSFLDKYGEKLSETEWLDHQPLFFKVYKQNREKVLATFDSDEWIKKGDIKIWYGEDNQQEKRKNIKICISILYSYGCEMRAKLSPDQTEDWILACNDCWLADLILYHLLRCFVQAVDGTEYHNDIPSIKGLIEGIKEEAQIQDVPRTQRTQASAIPGIGFQMPSMMASLMEGMGIRSPDGRPMQEVIAGIDTTSALNTAMSALANPETMRQIGGSLAGTISQLQSAETVDMNTIGENLKNTFLDIASTATPPPASGISPDQATPIDRKELESKIDQGLSTFKTMISPLIPTETQTQPGTDTKPS